MKKSTKTAPAPDTPFMNVKDAARATGLSQYYLRDERLYALGKKDGMRAA